MTAPERICASLATVHQCQGKWECVPFEIAPDSPQYILATPEALAPTPTDPGDGWTWNERLGWIGPDGKPADPRRRG